MTLESKGQKESNSYFLLAFNFITFKEHKAHTTAFEVRGGLAFLQSKGKSHGKATRIWVHRDYKKPASQEYSSWGLCCEKTA